MSDTETIDTNYQPLVHAKVNSLVCCSVVMVNFQVHTQMWQWGNWTVGHWDSWQIE